MKYKITAETTPYLAKNKERQRKEDIKRGVRTQTMISFRIDNDLLEKLKAKTNNKGRFINEILRKVL